MPLEEIDLPPPRLEPPGSLAEIVGADRRERVSHALGKAYRDVVRGFRGEIENPPDLVAHPRDEAEVEALLEWCADAGAAAIPYGGGTSVVGGVEAARWRRLRGRGDDRPGSARSRAGGRPGVTRGTNPGRRPGAGAQRAARRARSHPPPLPAVVRVLDAGRLDRDAGRRPLRDRLDPHRRPGRVGAGDHPERCVGEPQAARVRGGSEPRPDADRLRGHPRRDHRGLGAGARPPAAQALRRRRVRLVRRRRRGGARARAVRAQPGELPAARRGGVGAHPCVRGRPRHAGARVRVGAPARGRAHGPGARAGARPRRRSRGSPGARSGRRAGGRGRRLAPRVPRGALPARHLRGRRRVVRHLRDRHHLGPLRQTSTRR